MDAAPDTEVEAPPAVRLHRLVRHFGERTVLAGVSLELPPGTTVAVLGRNGAGKSTLLRILATLLRPHAGTVEVLGEPLPARAFAARGRVGFLGHDPLLYRDLSPRENLRLHARLHRVPAARVEELLDAVELGARADEAVRTLSRGMVQRAAIARAVLHAPELLLLDEPRANLDPGAAARLEPLIGRPSGVTRVLTSHDPPAALAEADLVLALHGGRPAYAGPASGFAEADARELYA